MAHAVGLADILRDHGQPYLDSHVLSAAQGKAWRAIVACRTQALGGHIECCDHCGKSMAKSMGSDSIDPDTTGNH